MTKFSSFKKQQKIFEDWRRYTEEEVSEDAYPSVEASPMVSNSEDRDEVDAHREADLIGNTEMVEEIIQEETEDADPELIRLLQKISDKLNTLSTIDGSIDYLASTMTGENPMLTKVKQDTLGRVATGKPVDLGMPLTAKESKEPKE